MTASYDPAPAYPRCGWVQEIHGPGSRCLMVGLVDVDLLGGGVATLCSYHAEKFAKRPDLGIARSPIGQAIPRQIEAG